MQTNSEQAKSLRVIGPGRAGTSLARALAEAGWRVLPPLGRGDDVRAAACDVDGEGVDLLVIATPDGTIGAVAAAVEPVDRTVVAHLAGSVGLDVLLPHRRRAVIHPLVGLPDADTGARALRGGAWFAVTGDELAHRVVHDLGGRSLQVADGDRVAYHAAACIASNHLVALLGQAERVAASAGVPLDALLDLVRATVDNVATLGPAAALTGPVARRDWATVDRHLAALDASERPAYEAMAAAAHRLSSGEGRPRVTSRGKVGGHIAVVDRVEAFRKELEAARAAGRTVGFVPTMGYLHEGHASLIRRAAAECDVVAVSVFVNPLQFAPTEDLGAYPRDLERDVALAEDCGAHLVLSPSTEEMYPEAMATTVSVGSVSEGLEGALRPTHFAGVATVVTKLLALAGPCRAYFGEKDFQQLAVIRRLVRDLSFPVEVVGVATVREPDGLAMSSRNVYLTDEERVAATVLHRALGEGVRLVEGGERDPAVVRDVMRAVIEAEPRAAIDYAEVVRADDLSAPDTLSGELRLLVAARFGRARLIDNRGVTI
ncbi:MAG: pantoate--beta-alanine ligase [Actinobacteria bacterium]|nr:MAG: pantoate--beta-alanine ligase [Actinomycetota bacterium]